MPACAVYGCGNYTRKTKNTNVRYYSFPKNEDICKQWINACQRKDEFNIQQGRICSKHFHPSAFFKDLKHELLNYKPKNTRDLKEDALPTEFLPNPKKTLDTPQAKQNLKPQENKSSKIIIAEILDDKEGSSNLNGGIGQAELFVNTSTKLEQVACPTEVSEISSVAELKKLVEKLEMKNCKLKKENKILKRNITAMKTKLENLKAMVTKHYGPG